MFQDPIAPLTPANFFQLSCDCFHLDADSPAALADLRKNVRKKYLLPGLEGLNSEDSFANVWLAWGNKGISLYVEAASPFHKSSTGNINNSSNIEIMVDTRDVKTAGFNTRFCHHFVFFPESIEGRAAWELTRFRTEDTHELCDSKELLTQGRTKESSGWSIAAFIPAHCLHGYDPEQFQRLGFTYKVNRGSLPPQHFAVSSKDYSIEQQPSLWATLKLVP